MAPYPIKRHDLAPPLEATLVDKNKQPLNLAGAASVTFIMSSEDANVTVTGPAEILQGVDVTTLEITHEGQVRYEWVAGDTDAVGVYLVEWEIDWGGNTPQTVPNKGYGELVISGDLG